MITERDPRTPIVLSWLREDAHENAEGVLLRALAEVDTTPQRRSWWPTWRTNQVNKFALIAATAAMVLAVAVVGYNLFPGLGLVGPGATRSPSPALLARGTFVTGDGAVEVEATGEGSRVTGRLTVSEVGFDASFTVDLQCARTTEDGLLMIGGVTTATTGSGSALAPVGSRAAIVLKRGSPVEAAVWSQRGGDTSQAASCLAFLDEKLAWERISNLDGDWTSPVDGALELGP